MIIDTENLREKIIAYARGLIWDDHEAVQKARRDAVEREINRLWDEHRISSEPNTESGR
jgi:hypothetical protein